MLGSAARLRGRGQVLSPEAPPEREGRPVLGEAQCTLIHPTLYGGTAESFGIPSKGNSQHAGVRGGLPRRQGLTLAGPGQKGERPCGEGTARPGAGVVCVQVALEVTK